MKEPARRRFVFGKNAFSENLPHFWTTTCFTHWNILPWQARNTLPSQGSGILPGPLSHPLASRLVRATQEAYAFYNQKNQKISCCAFDQGNALASDAPIFLI